MQKKLNLKVGDTVQVISGESKGSEGKILRIDRNKNRVIVEGVNVVKKHVKPSAANPQGGIEEAEAGIHISNVMLTQGGVASRVGRKKGEDGKLVRYFKKNGEVVKS
ncbi:MAG: 50S ribosomal protein L24 [Crocinitomicaceae bacterium]